MSARAHMKATLTDQITCGRGSGNGREGQTVEITELAKIVSAVFGIMCASMEISYKS